MIEISGYTAGLIVARPDTWEAIELLVATAGATDVRGVPIDSVQRRLWGCPVARAAATALPAKTALIIGDGAVTLDHDGHVDVRWSDPVRNRLPSQCRARQNRRQIRRERESAWCCGEGGDGGVTLSAGGRPNRAEPAGPRAGGQRTLAQPSLGPRLHGRLQTWPSQ